jgi:hypothetical protein
MINLPKFSFYQNYHKRKEETFLNKKLRKEKINKSNITI